MNRQKDHSPKVFMTVLKRHRLIKGLTLAQLAKRIGVSTAAVSSWETGTHIPHPKVIEKLARNLGITKKVLVEALSPQEPTVESAA